MLKHLKFKNWRSLKDVEIDDLQPINVFIGTNSSGKTNIVEGIQFYRDAYTKSLLQSVLELGYLQIQTDALHNNEDVEILLTLQLPKIMSLELITHGFVLRFNKRDVPFQAGDRLLEGNTALISDGFYELPARDVVSVIDGPFKNWDRVNELIKEVQLIITNRCQILGDNFSPLLKMSSKESGNSYQIESSGRNTLRILDFMRVTNEKTYHQLEEDLSWILDHVENVEIQSATLDQLDIELSLREQTGKKARTISRGTARLITILTAIYALDMPQQVSKDRVLKQNDSGLIIIEEPDTGLNPGVLSRFIEQIRNYAESENPRQFIFTTHNPAFLNYFRPEEVRIVSRDEQGYTKVERVPEYIDEIWLNEYGLGEVWTTNSFGGLAE